MVEYDDLLNAVEAGRLVALAPAYNVRGEPLLVIVTGHLPELHRERLQGSSCEQRARIAVRAVRQVREHYGI